MRLAVARVGWSLKTSAIDAANFLSGFIDNDPPDLDALFACLRDRVQGGDDLLARHLMPPIVFNIVFVAVSSRAATSDGSSE